MSFSAQFEFLCSELSILCIRIKLWGESNGLDLEADHLPSTLATVPALESTTQQCVANIINILNEVEAIRQKYEYRCPPVPCSTLDDDKLEPSISLVALSKTRAVTNLRRRIRDNQKQKSCLTIAKWTMCDAKKFEDKIHKLRMLIDGLERISVEGELTPPTSIPSSPVASEVNPPPYSRIQSTLSQYAHQFESSDEPAQDMIDTTHTSLVPYTSFLEPTSIRERDIENHYTAMIRHCGIVSRAQDHPRWRAREKLSCLSDSQFQELRTDVYDDLYRRELEMLTTTLPSDLCFLPPRNEARAKLSALDAIPFNDLVVDVLFEMERRFPSLQAFQSPMALPRPRSTFSSRRQRTPPPPLQFRAAHPTTIETSIFEPDTPLPETSSFEPDTPPTSPLISPCSPSSPLPLQSNALPTFLSSPLFRNPTFASEFQQFKPLPQTPTQQTAPPSPTTSQSQPSPSPFTPSIPPSPNSPNTPISPTPSSTPPTQNSSFFQSFRISPTLKTSEVLPAALEKYGIDLDEGEHYSLYVVYGAKERKLEMDEQPLMVFKELLGRGLGPTFVLRKAAEGPLAGERCEGRVGLGDATDGGKEEGEFGEQLERCGERRGRPSVVRSVRNSL